MANLGKVHTGDVNTDIVMTVQDTQSGTNVAFDLQANPGDYYIIVIDPDGNESSEFAAAIVNSPGTDGQIHYLNTDTTLFDESGAWQAKARLRLDDGSIYTSNPITFEVLG
jgi:hypothetical protein